MKKRTVYDIFEDTDEATIALGTVCSLDEVFDYYRMHQESVTQADAMGWQLEGMEENIKDPEFRMEGTRMFTTHHEPDGTSWTSTTYCVERPAD